MALTRRKKVGPMRWGMKRTTMISVVNQVMRPAAATRIPYPGALEPKMEWAKWSTEGQQFLAVVNQAGETSADRSLCAHKQRGELEWAIGHDYAESSIRTQQAPLLRFTSLDNSSAQPQAE